MVYSTSSWNKTRGESLIAAYKGLGENASRFADPRYSALCNMKHKLECSSSSEMRAALSLCCEAPSSKVCRLGIDGFIVQILG